MSRSDSDAASLRRPASSDERKRTLRSTVRPRHQRRGLGHETVLLGLAGDRGLLSGRPRRRRHRARRAHRSRGAASIFHSPTDRAGSRIRLVGRRGRPTAVPRRPVDGGGRPCGRPASTRGGRQRGTVTLPAPSFMFTVSSMMCEVIFAFRSRNSHFDHERYDETARNRIHTDERCVKRQVRNGSRERVRPGVVAMRLQASSTPGMKLSRS